ncbi:MED6 mediator sub complex component-domain-containing protein [Irpex rosettiformis]|uniref:MED6 mediator sub complex component-domain-containing protein n=1 Tax=Irpex rosettiformis TaxID=378272 RepID=A0ACB8UJJ2_9APHY|nr:MED6 mediator sub complex component-domain-containing protein [Irpex rosettiformis]
MRLDGRCQGCGREQRFGRGHTLTQLAVPTLQKYGATQRCRLLLLSPISVVDHHFDFDGNEQCDMDLNDLHPPDDYSHRFFIWHEWIQANGPLTNENVFDYFATSMFYDKQSNNQVLRMQTMHTGIPLQNEAEELRRFTGIEFAVVHAQPPSFFVIHRRERLSPDEVRPLVAYFIMNNRIYQSPDVYTLVSNRLLTSLHSLQSSLDILRQHRPTYTPRTGFVWPIKEAATADEKKRDADGEPATTQTSETLLTEMPAKKKVLVTSGGAKKRQNNTLLMNAMRTTAIHASQSFVLPTALSESNMPDTPASASVGRSSTTPAPASQASPSSRTVGVPTSTSQESAPAKTPSAANKKKKKRGSVAQ